MDDLLIFGAVILFCGLVVGPLVAIVALRRSAAVRFELAALQRRVEELERCGVAPAAETTAFAPTTPGAAIAADAMTVKLSEPRPEPVAEAIDPWRAQPTPQPQPEQKAASLPESKPSSAFGGIISSLAGWFLQGNPLAKLGILLLFLGLSFLLRYTVEHALFPLELRLVAAALFAVVLLAVGWRLRHKQPVYALILQGGATGALYLTVFGAFRLWQMLPMTLAFALLVAICAASVGLAIVQKALSLAMLASLGGYLAPLLLSTGGGSHVALFSFYLLLSVGILAISIRQHWRELNLLGLLFTFGVGGLWGLNEYRPAFYLSCQLFLIANTLFLAC